MESSKNETVATFSDVCGVFGSKNDPFFTFAFGLKVINLFKAKMEAFRERKSSKVDLKGKFPCEMRFGDFRPEKWNFRVHPTPNFLVRDSHSEISVNLEGVLLVVRGKFRK